MTIAGKAESVADQGIYGFAIPSPKAGQGMGVHVSMIRVHPDNDKLNFWMNPDSAERLARALSESLEWIKANKECQHEWSGTAGTTGLRVCLKCNVSGWPHRTQERRSDGA